VYPFAYDISRTRVSEARAEPIPKSAHIRGSSNGRTQGFGPCYLGSNPNPLANQCKEIEW
jgi:hypothetical protein